MRRSPTRHRARAIAGLPLIMATAAALAAAVAPALAAETPAKGCGERRAVVADLGERFAEVRTAIGLGQDGRLLEVFAAPGGTTWTMVATTPQCTSCIVTTGQHWHQRTSPVPGLESSWRP